jgi:hypothetical protein
LCKNNRNKRKKRKKRNIFLHLLYTLERNEEWGMENGKRVLRAANAENRKR